MTFTSFLSQQFGALEETLTALTLPPELLAELLLLQATYQEEGQHLFPTIYLCDDAEAARQVLSGNEIVWISSVPRDANLARQIFKHCAVLAQNSWSVLVELSASDAKYGVMRTDSDLTHSSSFERLRALQLESSAILGLTRSGRNLVELRSSRGQKLYLSLSVDDPYEKSPEQVINLFSASIVSDSWNDNLKIKLQAFYKRVGYNILHSSAGALIVILRQDGLIPHAFEDGVLLPTPINLDDLIDDSPDGGPDLLNARLEGVSALIRSMTEMDGIVMMTTSGSVLGYNFFIRSSDLSDRTVIGGARRRAYESLRQMRDSALAGVFYKSQDGVVDFTKLNEPPGTE